MWRPTNRVKRLGVLRISRGRSGALARVAGAGGPDSATARTVTAAPRQAPNRRGVGCKRKSESSRPQNYFVFLFLFLYVIFPCVCFHICKLDPFHASWSNTFDNQHVMKSSPTEKFPGMVDWVK